MHRTNAEPTPAAPTYRAHGSDAPDDVEDPAEVAPGGEALDLVAMLCERLAAEGIRYCHWKSNDVLERSARGENDLDLLVSRGDALAFAGVMRRLGFKDASPPRARRFPGVFHSYGLDRPSGRLVHVHAYLELVLGDDMTKNHRLPIEEAFLDSAEQGPLFRTPAPEFEFVVFVVRMALKHLTPDALLFRHASLSSREVHEFRHLSDRADVDRSRAIVGKHLPFLGQRLWNDCLTCLRPGAKLSFRVRTGRRLERALAPYARRPSAVDLPLRVWRRTRLGVARRVLARTPPRQRLASGGALIAIVGGDGAGKSTAVDELQRWLSGDLLTATVHLGKPPWSLTSSVVQRAWDLARRKRPARRGTGAAARSERHRSGWPSLARLTRKVMISRDRSITYARARRFVSRGGIVIADRFPLSEITLMDRAATSLTASSEASRVVQLLARLEGRYYRRIEKPDILVVLRVHPDVAVQRRLGQDEESSVRPRAEEIWRTDWGSLGAVVVDADQPKDAVIAEIKSAIWSRLSQGG